ncbi:hypothetical protein KKR91_01295 [Arthrobacter jiangjiafuii]|uniref:Uncharacterized protein n=1 Tax=Arthrobacter jiangjiafuii TaxID=2817475 RepID=A0A975M5V3_9MICC|nr:hypothetical protein [Arthrobacter jiangjiafuii]MBP3044857.1 hypothetical protein [Arthrobacter jiangjiafuii]QWC10319.1 hypothetical protein KKR91_01295 [Arthrobacter jiangjiafuii]
MSNALEEIKIRVADCQTYHFGMGVADKLAHEDAPKLIAALEAVESVIAEHEARTPFPDADKIDKAYSLGKRHAYDRVRYEITEALQ